MAFELQHGDVIHVYWPLNTVGSRSRYSLAYSRGNSDVMMSIDVQHHIQIVTTLSMGDYNLFNGISTDRTSNSELILTTKLSRKEQSEYTVTIIGSIIIICTIIVLAVLLVIVGITVTVLICRHKNRTEHSLVAADHADSSDIELDSNKAYITCFQAKEEQQGTDTTECTGVDANIILTEPNLAYGTLKANDYDYVVVTSFT